MSIKPNKFGNNYDLIEGDLDPLAVRILENDLDITPGLLTKYNLIDWEYIPDVNEMVLIFKKGFNWPYSPGTFDPIKLNRKRYSEYLGISFVVFSNVYNKEK